MDDAPTAVECPICGMPVQEDEVNAHVNLCLNKQESVGTHSSHKRPRLEIDSDSAELGLSTGSDNKDKDFWNCLKYSNAENKGNKSCKKNPQKTLEVPRKRSVDKEKTECLKTSEIAEQKHENLEFTPVKIESDTLKGGSTSDHKNQASTSHFPTPLAEQMRPTSLDDFIGHDKVIGIGKMLRTLLDSNQFLSMILWGPPGCGKTTLVRIISQSCRKLSSTWRFTQLPATTSGIADVKTAVQAAKNEKSSFKRRTVLFVDEIHRFNKLQQDAFLPHVEDGTIILVGATTENPSFHVNNALLSRCQVIVLEKLSAFHIRKILERALSSVNVGIRNDQNEELGSKALDFISGFCDGDARSGLNILQRAIEAKSIGPSRCVEEADVKEAVHRSVQYDKAGDEHYNAASALQKSIRGSDCNGAIYWLARMIEGGEDPMFIARRLVVCASEDVGLADDHALPLAVATFQACHFLGMPECAINLAHCMTYLARATKSNATYAALARARESIREHKGPLPAVPLHLRNAPTKLMKDLGYHAGYQYNHTAKGPVIQQYLPTELQGMNFFEGTTFNDENNVRRRRDVRNSFGGFVESSPVMYLMLMGSSRPTRD